MSGDPTRIVHGITIRDDLAWMEPMQGPAWQARVHEEQKRFDNLSRQPEVRRIAKIVEKELEEGFESYGLSKFGEGTGIEVGELGTLSWRWRFAQGGSWNTAGDLCTDGEGHVWAVEEGGSGDESYSVCLYRRGRQDAVWKHAGVGPYVAVCRGRCFALEVRKRLVCFRLVSWDAKTGKDRKVHHELRDYRYNMELFGCEDNIWVKHQAGDKLDVFTLGADGELRVIDGISLDARSYVLGSKASDWISWTAKEGWQASSCLGWRLPPLSEECNPEHLNTRRGFLVTKHKGQRCLWKLWQFKAPEQIWKGVGQIKIDPWGGPWVRFVQPGEKAKWWDSTKPETGPPLASRAMTWSQVDGGAPYVLLEPKGGKKTKGLFLVAYGAYGIQTSLETYRWEPLRRRGFAIGILLLRGGGDDSPTWEHSGRVKGREVVLLEAEKTVRALQAKTGVEPARTCLYGRSAGGLWAGGLTAKFPDGEIAGLVYMEVPYLDVVRTTTNRSLPLTEIETDEFGLPSQRLSDLVSMMRWSPMELLALTAGQGVRGVWQLVRTGMNDSQVYAYESMKWVTRCRSGFDNKDHVILAIEDGQGHFMHGAKGYRQKAVDLALLLQKIAQ